MNAAQTGETHEIALVAGTAQQQRVPVWKRLLYSAPMRTCSCRSLYFDQPQVSHASPLAAQTPLGANLHSPLGCASCRAGQIPAAVAPVGAPRNGEGGMLRNSALAAAAAMLFALPALAQNPPATPPVQIR